MKFVLNVKFVSFDTQTRYRLDKCKGLDSDGREDWVSCHGEGDASSTVNLHFTVKGLAQGNANQPCQTH